MGDQKFGVWLVVEIVCLPRHIRAESSPSLKETPSATLSSITNSYDEDYQSYPGQGDGLHQRFQLSVRPCYTSLVS
jgi:hypothetical protein